MTVLTTSIGNDWDRDFTNKILSHKDMTLDYDTNTGTAPAFGDYVRGGTSGAVGKILSGTDLGGTNATGSFVLTNVIGKFEDGETLVPLDSLGFDTVINGGFKTGDRLDEVGAGTAEFQVYAIEFNHPGDVAGAGTVYGNTDVAGFLDNDNLEVSTASNFPITFVNTKLPVALVPPKSVPLRIFPTAPDVPPLT